MLYGALTEHSERKVCSPVEPSSRACWQSWDPRVFTSDTKLKTTSRTWVQDVLTLARTHKLVPPPPNTHTQSEPTCIYHRNKSKWCGWIFLSSVACGIFMPLKQHLHYFLCYQEQEELTWLHTTNTPRGVILDWLAQSHLQFLVLVLLKTYWLWSLGSGLVKHIDS